MGSREARQREAERIRYDVEHYTRLLSACTDEGVRIVLYQLICEAEDRLSSLAAEIDIGGSAAAAPDRIRRWRAKAEECRTMADSMSNAAARHSLQQLARNYDALADRAGERSSKPEQDAGSPRGSAFLRSPDRRGEDRSSFFPTSPGRSTSCQRC